MASNCGWALEYIDALEMPDVFELGSYWAVEPPQNWLLKALTGYKEKESEVQDPRLMNQTTKKARPFEQLPKHIQCLIVAQSGLSEPEFHRRRQARRREELLGEKIRSCKKEVA